MSATKKKQSPSRQAGPATLEGSDQAKRQVAVFLEVLSGLRTTSDACELLGLSLPRYYILETRGLQGMIKALEPLPRGRAQTPQRQISALIKENEQLQRELLRHQALVRAANRSIGLPAPSKSKKKSGARKRKRKPRVRALKVIEALRSEGEEASAPSGAEGLDEATGSAA